MKTKYLGETLVKDLDQTPYKGYTKTEWALEYIAKYGGIDGSHHKDWVMDQVSRILLGTPVIVSFAQWSDGQSEYRIKTDEPSKAYLEWVHTLRKYNEETHEYEYSYDTGVAP